MSPNTAHQPPPPCTALLKPSLVWAPTASQPPHLIPTQPSTTAPSHICRRHNPCTRRLPKPTPPPLHTTPQYPQIYILTQFNSTSLNRHLGRAYNMGSGVRFGGDGFVEVLAATQTPTDKEWFQGTADAVRQYAWLLSDVKNRAIEDVSACLCGLMVLAADCASGG